MAFPDGMGTTYSQSVSGGQLEGYPGLASVLLTELKLPHPIKEKTCSNNGLHLARIYLSLDSVEASPINKTPLKRENENDN